MDISTELNGRLEYIVIPAIQKLLTDAEFEQLTIESEGPRLDRFVASIQACGETLSVIVSDCYMHESMDEARDRFFEDLRDEISETEFGWGQLRDGSSN
ncbi:hypothetical protein [Brevibacterium permense]|uniref:Uncharacterized protein n=1 Tax=Brevibacterium permense TaxID=234834 RepID=A0ABN2A4S5_9MICO|nr:hypothetical protein [Brevibacterium permense]